MTPPLQSFGYYDEDYAHRIMQRVTCAADAGITGFAPNKRKVDAPTNG